MKFLVLKTLSGGRKTSKEVAEAIGVDSGKVSKYLLDYKRQGLVRVVGEEDREGRGRKRKIWEITERGVKRLEYLANSKHEHVQL